jgi:glycine/D-amino acid oxidase-like deaminating enzyme
MRDHRTVSYWLETCGDDLAPRQALDGSIDVDVAILGAGYTGLWTAYYLLTHDPMLKIALLEREIAGFGASGRNGAWCTSGFPTGVGTLAKRYGLDIALGVQRAMFDAVDEIGRVTESAGIDIEWIKGGSLRIARGRHQLPQIQQSYETYQQLGLGDAYQYLDKQQTDERIRVTDSLGAIYTPHTATIHPGKLVRGLARLVEQMGATIYEQTEVTDFTTGAYPALHTHRGHARAKTIVLAGESYLSQLPKTRRAVMPAYSLITLTEPLSDADWRQIGWEAHECVSSVAFMVNYLSRTSDGRILFGGRGAPYHFGSSIKDDYDRHPQTHRMLQENVRNWFPMLRDVKFTHSWGGPLGWSRDWMPTMRYDAAESVAIAGGYTGTGVATANLAGRLLADLIQRRETELTRLPMATHTPRQWEPEPLRFLGVRFVQRGFEKLDQKAERTGAPPNGKSLVERLTRH